jgi:uncharacterized repeat protein (TIGR02543 family)
MVGKSRSGLANDRRGYGCSRPCPPTYKVKYDSNGSTSGQAPKDRILYKAGFIVTVLGNTGSLAKTEYAFVGWNTAADGSGISYSPGATFLINDNTQLYAKWTRTYTVTYDVNSSTGGSAPTDTLSPYIDGSTVTVLANAGSLVKTGFVFAGWNSAADGLGTSYSIGPPPASFTINANATLYAKWTPTYTVTYDPNGSTSGTAPAISSYAAGSIVTVVGNPGTLVKTNYSFAGWNTLPNGSGTNYSQGNTFTINANVTLHAKWTPNYTVTYDANESTSGNAPGISSYASGSTVTVVGNPGSLVKTGSTFAGWNTLPNGSGTNYSQGNTFTINANATLYAEWILASIPLPPTALSSVGGDLEAYILFTQVGTVTNYEYSTDDGDTFVAFDPPQIYSPVNIKTLSLNGGPLTNGTTYTVRLKAVNSGESSDPSDPVTVTPEITALLTDNRRIYLDANNTSSYSGSGTAWTNLVSSGSYSATLNGSPTFNTTDPSNNYFEFNPGALTGQFAEIIQHPNINPVLNQPFTIQMWVRINNVGLQGGNLVSKVFFDGEGGDYDGYALYYKANTTLELHSNRSRVNYFTSVTGVLSSGWALYTTNVQIGNGGGRENKIFVNARQLGVTQLSNGQIMPNNISQDAGTISSTKNMTFPRGFPQGTSEYGKCDIGEFYYYNAELTTTQIIQNFDATKHRYNV